jgi:hypothetical protein
MAKKKEIKDVETPDDAIEEIARLVKEGFTSGLLCCDGLHTNWELKTNSWQE